MGTRSAPERISVLETKADEIREQINLVSVDVKEIKAVVSTIPSMYLTREEFEKFKDQKTILSWLTHTSTAILTAIFIFLLTQQLGG